MSLSRRDCLRLGLVAGLAALAPISAIAGRPAALRLGLWGCSPRGLALAVSALRSATDVELVAIADPDSARAARAAAWWRHPAHRPSLRTRVRLDSVLSGSAAADALAALPSVDAVLMADGAHAPVCSLANRHVCLWPSNIEPALLASLQRATVLTEAHGRVLSVCADVSGACSGAARRAQTLSGFVRAIRQGQRGDVDGQVAALLVAASARLA